MKFDPEVSEVTDLYFDCDKDCAYCCLCPPGLLEGEGEELVNNCGSKEERIGKDRIGDFSSAVKIKGDAGACAFLSDRTCESYETRPHFCRQYPLMVYSGWRLQLSAIRSCRGFIGHKDRRGASSPLIEIFDHEVNILGEEYYLDTLDQTKASYLELEEEPIHCTLETVQSIALEVAESVGSARSLERRIGPKVMDEKKARTTLLETYCEDLVSTFSATDPIELPVYPALDNTWRIFKFTEGELMSEFRLDPSGDMTHMKDIPVKDLGLWDLTKKATMVLGSYLKMAFSRDVFYGMVARESVLDDRPMNEMAKVTATRLATALWFKASILRSFGPGPLLANMSDEGRKIIEEKVASEAIIFMDADLLDSFALGAII